MVRLLRRKQNSSILRTYGISPSPLIFSLARSINLAGAVEAVGVSHTDSGEGMLSLGRTAYLSLGERPASGGFKAEPYPFNASRSRQMSRSDREGIINCCSLALWERVRVRVLPAGKNGGVYVKH